MNIQPSEEAVKRLTRIFLVEAREHVQVLGTGLLELEKAADRDAQLPLLETIFREAHSLKGAARAVNAGEIELRCQKIESEFGNLKSGKCALSAESLDRLHRIVAGIGRLVEQSAECGLRIAECQSAENGARKEDLGMATAHGGTVLKTPRSEIEDRKQSNNSPIRNPQSAIRNDDTVRIATSKLDAIFVEAEELLGVKLAQAERVLEVRTLAALVAERDRFRVETTPLVRSARQQLEAAVDAGGRGAGGRTMPAELLSRLLALLDQEREQADAVSTGVADFARAMADDRRRFDTLVDHLLEDVKKALMLPFTTILAGFPKMVRDLARDAGKEIEFSMHGADIEIDKRILEKIKDPLLHLVRNAVDHGIEVPAERTHCGKPPRGNITMAIAQVGGKIDIHVADDGAGINVIAVKAAAVKAGSITADAAATLRDQDAWQLVFGSGVSTSRQVTTVSGRGLGMAIVKDSVVNLGGTVGIESKPGVGTTARIVLPLTLATLRGTLVREANREFIIPTANVVQVVRVSRESVKHVENRDSIFLDGSTLALVRLADVLGLVAGPSGDAASLTVVVLDHGQARMAFAVEQVMDEQEVLAKPLGRLLPEVRNLAGATVFGTGRVVPILSVPGLLQSATGCARITGPDPDAGASAETVHVRRLLVVDDSITARTALQSMLESAGFEVKTAPDGAAAFALLRTETFNLVVSDVEMPRMDGFELTKRIRAEPKLAELPVVLVTAREAKEDRDRGVDAGANAYIVKSSFDQGNLLEVIGTLI